MMPCGRGRTELRESESSLLIAGNPATGALLGLADLATARGDVEAAEELRARAELAAA